jgi:hypothetical protein
MPTWLQITLAVVALLAPWITGYFGVQSGMAVGMAVNTEQIKRLQEEVLLLRTRYHDRLAPIVTEHEAYLAVIKRKLGIE